MRSALVIVTFVVGCAATGQPAYSARPERPSAWSLPPSSPGQTCQYFASDGNHYPCGQDGNQLRTALRAIGAHDLACPADRVVPRFIYSAETGNRSYFAEGCGRRGVYVFGRTDAPPYTDGFFLVSVVPLAD